VEIVAFALPLLVAAGWTSSRVSAIEAVAPGGLFGLLVAEAILALAVHGAALVVAALTMAVSAAALIEVVLRADRRSRRGEDDDDDGGWGFGGNGGCPDPEPPSPDGPPWWPDFEAEFYAYAARQLAPAATPVSKIDGFHDKRRNDG
jgi:hypothetical protein